MLETLLKLLRKNIHFKSWRFGLKFLRNKTYLKVQKLSETEARKVPKKSVVLNEILSSFDRPTHYLEIGVRNPADNFDLINTKFKISVDPGYEYLKNPATYKMTSDEFFSKVKIGELELPEKFDVIFIDGLHRAGQVDLDIKNSFMYLKDDGYIILHDCNPPSEWHAREDFQFKLSPALGHWNGTTWKAFYKQRADATCYSCCIDTDWGLGCLSKSNHKLGKGNVDRTEFYEYDEIFSDRKTNLGLISFDEFKKRL